MGATGRTMHCRASTPMITDAQSGNRLTRLVMLYSELHRSTNVSP